MKFTLQQRRRPPRSGPRVALFPFLAVLICTMGVLVPLLLAVSRTARLQAEAGARAKAVSRVAEVQIQREDIQWRIAQLRQSRKQTESQLADARLELGHIEDHIRRLKDQVAQYQNTMADLGRAESDGAQRQMQSAEELRRAREQVEQAKRRLDETAKAAAASERSYAVVPYEGPNQTRRRPVYIECRGDAIVLQPEGIELRASDFEGPLGPSNPLAMAIRAANEHLLASREFDPKIGEPYPMLLVRPDGIAAYYAARAAMKSWGCDFGYELIDGDWKLAYQQPDPRLAQLLRQVVATARAQQARWIAAAPREYESRRRAVHAAGGSGGDFGREGGTAGDVANGDYQVAEVSGPIASGYGSEAWGGGTGADGGTRGRGTRTQGGGTRSAVLQGGGDAGTGGIGTGSSIETGGNAGAGGNVGGGVPGGVGDVVGEGTGKRGTEANGGVAGVGGATGVGDGVGSGDGGYAQNRSATGGSTTNGNTNVHPLRGTTEGAVSNCPAVGDQSSSGCPRNANGGGSVSRAGAATNTNSANADPNGTATNARPDGYVVGQPPRELPAEPKQQRRMDASDDEPQPAQTSRGWALRPGEWEPTPERPKERPEDKPKDDEAEKKREKDKKLRRLADRRGQDWGLRDPSRDTFGVTRPIRVECHPDRLVVISDRGPAFNKTVPFGPRTETSVDPLVSVVWEQVEAWGIAGRGMYWRPVLNVKVAPGAEQRFAEMCVLLDGSGLKVVKK